LPIPRRLRSTSRTKPRIVWPNPGDQPPDVRDTYYYLLLTCSEHSVALGIEFAEQTVEDFDPLTATGGGMLASRTLKARSQLANHHRSAHTGILVAHQPDLPGLLIVRNGRLEQISAAPHRMREIVSSTARAYPTVPVDDRHCGVRMKDHVVGPEITVTDGFLAGAARPRGGGIVVPPHEASSADQLSVSQCERQSVQDTTGHVADHFPTMLVIAERSRSSVEADAFEVPEQVLHKG
jgi:hypothetical protein